MKGANLINIVTNMFYSCSIMLKLVSVFIGKSHIFSVKKSALIKKINLYFKHDSMIYYNFVIKLRVYITVLNRG